MQSNRAADVRVEGMPEREVVADRTEQLDNDGPVLEMSGMRQRADAGDVLTAVGSLLMRSSNQTKERRELEDAAGDASTCALISA